MFIQEEIKNEVSQTVADPKNPHSINNPETFYIEFGKNKKGNKGQNIFSRNDFKEVNEYNIGQHIRSYIQNNKGWGLYSTAFQYSTSDPHTADLRGDFFLDFDDDDDISNAQEDALKIIQHLTLSPNYKIPSNMMRVFFSGSKGVHVMVPYECFGFEWHPHLEKIYRIMAEELLEFTPNKTLDMKVYERRRLLRLPRSQHPKTGCYKVPMELKNLLVKNEQDIYKLSKDQNYGSWIKYREPKRIAEASRYFEKCDQKFASRFKNKFSNRSEEQTLDFDPPAYLELIKQGPVKGKRNLVASMLVTFWRRRGKTEQEAWDALVDWNNGSMDDWELKTLFKSNFHGPYVYGYENVKAQL